MIISCDFGFRQRVGKCILLSGFLGFCLFSGNVRLLPPCAAPSASRSVLGTLLGF
ncbi:hypothetical protein BN891_22390 [Bacteroides xylanisolvens SD CC 2a]|nr:hypothetical protein BN891_22390 [Bacteroides xylanisolvens SD CC 2a]